VMSSGLCKDAEGAVAPLEVKALKDGVDDSVDTGDVDETDDRPGAELLQKPTW
jgi:hypothetical protein